MLAIKSFNRLILVLFLFTIPFFSGCNKKTKEKEVNPRFVITQEKGGRLGDNLVAFLHAYWFAEKHQLPFVSQNFSYADQFALSDKIEINYGQLDKSIPNHIHFRDYVHFTRLLQSKKSLQLIVPFFSENLHEFQADGTSYLFQLPWHQKEFRKTVRELLTPKNPIKKIIPPEGAFSIALHIRRSGGFDSEDMYEKDPLKFPPLSYYQKALSLLCQEHQDKNIYVYLFTDDLNPKQLAEQLKAHLDNGQVTIDYRTDDPGPNSNVLVDLFSMADFDSLIRSRSHFSFIASILGNHQTILSPVNSERLKSGEILITHIEQEHFVNR